MIKQPMRDEFVRDLENMEEILSKTAQRCDIWQDRFVHAIAKAVYHLLTATIRRIDNDKT